METEALALAKDLDFSFWALFARATFTVKMVMLLLIGASFWSWSIIVQRTILYRAARREAAQFDRAFWSGEPLDELFEELGPEPKGRAERVFASGMIEWQRSHKSDGQMIAGAQRASNDPWMLPSHASLKSCKKGWAFWPPSGPLRPLLVCLERFGAS
jgi:biopolymer transport protein TolQ